MYTGNLAFLDESVYADDIIRKYHWLKSDYNDVKWIIGNNTLYWDRTLSDGTNLLDEVNSNLLKFMRKLVVEIRRSPLCKNIGDNMHYRRANELFCLLDCIVWDKKRLNPQVSLFSKLTNEDLQSFIINYAIGGSNRTGRYIERLMVIFEREIINNVKIRHELTSNLDKMPNALQIITESIKNVKTYSDDDLVLIRAWLYRNGYYEFIGRSKKISAVTHNGLLNTAKIAKLLCVRGNNFTAEVKQFLQQFNYIDMNDDIECIIIRRNRECRSANSYTENIYADDILKESQLHGVVSTIKALSNLCNTDKGLPDLRIFENISESSISSMYDVKYIKRYKTPPVEVAMHVMNNAVKYIVQYGRALVDCAIYAGIRLKSISGKQTDEIVNSLILENIEKQKCLKPLNIRYVYSHYSAKKSYYATKAAPKARDTLSLEDAINLLIAAVYIITAVLSARRSIELCSLKMNCVSGRKKEYQLSFLLAKANIDGAKLLLERPIPDFVANSIDLIREFTSRWMKIWNVNGSGNLFIIPTGMNSAITLTEQNVEYYLDRLSDYIQVPLKDGLRWYVNPHECRRFFGITFFWQFKLSNIAALQWMYAHLDISHTYRYIKEVVGGSEISKEEAIFTSTALKTNFEDESLSQLRSLVFERFKTEDIELIESDDLEMYLCNMINNGALKITPHSIITSEGVAYEILYEILQ